MTNEELLKRVDVLGNDYYEREMACRRLAEMYDLEPEAGTAFISVFFDPKTLADHSPGEWAR